MEADKEVQSTNQALIPKEKIPVKSKIVQEEENTTNPECKSVEWFKKNMPWTYQNL